ncbi:hypothetical protein [uncultured Enterococcus sp.]|uniref:hypothetical protein n=1 Tax=uncultured Enterococcus sp. TaxID=167972 RepID=UPI002AA824F7|nr:hypothetical protein [uncultured Enterococcus sp.]
MTEEQRENKRTSDNLEITLSKLTELEKVVYQAIWKYKGDLCFLDLDIVRDTGIEMKRLRGVAGSLVKKELIVFVANDDMEVLATEFSYL